MSRKYRQIQQYEKEIMGLKSKGYTKREIGEKLGLSYEQIHNFISKYNEKQRKINAGIVIKKKGRPPMDCVVSEKDKVKINSFIEAIKLIDEYIYFYNHQRIQLKTKLTPMEYRCQYVA